jgi:hypothetical protein
MNTWVVRVLGPDLAKVMYPRWFLYRVIRDEGRLPEPRDRGIAIDAPLYYEPAHYAEKAIVVVKAVLHQRVEAIGPLWGPGFGDLDHEIALGGLKLHPVGIRRLCRGGGLSRGPFRFTTAGQKPNTGKKSKDFHCFLILMSL